MPHMANLPWLYLFTFINLFLMYMNNNLFSLNLMNKILKTSQTKILKKKW